MDWNDLDQGRKKLWALMNAVINLQLPENYLPNRGCICVSERTLLHGVTLT